MVSYRHSSCRMEYKYRQKTSWKHIGRQGRPHVRHALQSVYSLAAQVMNSPCRSYTGWVGDDYPAYYPMEVRDVIMFPEDTVHYPINGEDALQQWETQFPTIGEGWVCLGPERRPFALTMYHQLHCLGRLRLALEDSANRTYEAQAEHVQHCLNYLRMMALCRADVTLEPVVDASLAVDLTQPHLCRDWVQVYDEASRNAEQCRKPRT